MNKAARESCPTLDGEKMREEILAGLRAPPKVIASKYFYDAAGSRLFNAICHTPEYYLTRTEKSLLSGLAGEVGRLIGGECIVIEPGSGNGEKAMILLKAVRPLAYVPVEISEAALNASVEEIAGELPWLKIFPVCADFTHSDVENLPSGRRVVFFPGSTIGNFEPSDAIRLLMRLGRLAGPGGALLIGVDLKKNEEVINAAYNDIDGVTASFNLNLLMRLNRELDANFDLSKFEHRAFYNPHEGRVEMHLASRCEQRVHIAGETISFRAGETIHTENSYKYTIEEFRRLAEKAGWIPLAAWADPGHLFSVQFFARED